MPTQPREVFFLRAKVEADWLKLASMIGQDACDRAVSVISARPLVRRPRNHPLRGSLSTRYLGGESLSRWQYEITGAARIRYLIDEVNDRILIEQIHFGHPKDTE